MQGTHVINVYGRMTNQPKPRSLAVAQVIRKNGFAVLMPAKCFYKTSGLMKKSVLKDVVGPWNKSKVDKLVRAYGAQVLECSKEEKGA